jgi:hypothetical protein
MRDQRYIQFVVTSYPYLQGLTALPYGFALTLAAVWANSLRRRAQLAEVLAVSALMVGLLLLSWPLSRYYARTFGKAITAAKVRRVDTAMAVLGGLLALGAFWLDVTRTLPFSAIGLVCALSLAAVFFRGAWLATAKYLLYYPVLATVAVLLSVLPSLGLPSWWTVLGFRAQLYAVTAAMGVLFAVAGIWSHVTLMRFMPSTAGSQHV